MIKTVKKVLCVAMLTAMTSTMMVGCNSTNSSKDDSTTLNFGCTKFSDSLDPSAMPNAAWSVSRYAIGEGLFRFDDEMNAVNYLCDDYSVDDSHTTWKFHIRENLKFSNGKEVTASSVVDSIEYIYKQEKSGKGSSTPSVYMTYDSITADDDSRTVTIVTSKSYADLTKVLAHPYFVILDMESDLDENPVGTGPYAISKYDTGVSLSMVANEHYWKEEVPYEKLNITFIDDSTTKAMALQNGDVDIVENITTANDLSSLKDDSNYNVSQTAGVRIGFSYMNQAGVLKNENLRKAVLMAIDDDTMCNTTVGGMYTPGFSVLPSSLDYNHDKLKDTTPFNIQEAKKILDDAGIVDSDNNGYRELDGKEINLSYYTYDSRNLVDFTEAIASSLEHIGIKVTVNKTDADTEWNMLVTGEYDLLATNWMTVQDGDPYGYLENWYSKSNANYCAYKSDEYDKLYENLADEMDEEKRKEIVQKLQQILIDDSAVLVHGYYNSNMCSNTYVTGANISIADYYWISTNMKPAE
ncbi:ABC transporter substrate-binding protein [Terrisporobacter sp.]|uniref:ABC transporter substrate-binding protein n=1 Tax=Terrisporobacter sp. TaxID=1965305 RepID=UPI0026076190|nr:ABC transporter substrate-binding protein [Terrisporobacter sp.]